ncbi:hypothetical protein, partial [Klebsiella aerogenes]|uniref:hypothetical protein n=1 Tax=Klebsiella aerogenes TaxID=548 RepID=UPI0019546A66
MMALTAALSVSAVLDAVGFPGGLIRLSLVVVAGLTSAGLGLPEPDQWLERILVLSGFKSPPK